ncbi:MAG: hypothetical protein HQ567_06650 [Candidatus Nealsonbacteria bacterium]|nr:hypothetical protein [Candidatus Nealsonbacteria bacterium]
MSSNDTMTWQDLLDLEPRLATAADGLKPGAHWFSVHQRLRGLVGTEAAHPKLRSQEVFNIAYKAVLAMVNGTGETHTPPPGVEDERVPGCRPSRPPPLLRVAPAQTKFGRPPRTPQEPRP